MAAQNFFPPMEHSEFFVGRVATAVSLPKKSARTEGAEGVV